MKKWLVVLLGVFMFTAISAQDLVVAKLRSETSRNIKKEVDTTHWNWKTGGLYNFNLSQSSLSNWAAGGDNFNMALTSYFNYFAFYQKPRHNWDNNVTVKGVEREKGYFGIAAASNVELAVKKVENASAIDVKELRR